MAIAKWYADYLKKLHPDPAIALKIAKLETKLLKVMPGSQVQERLKEEIKELKKMPIKKKAPAKKAAPKKAAPLGPKAKLMKLQVTTLRNKAKKLGISDVTKRTKENLVQSIILGEARKKRGTAAGKKATAKRKASTNPNRQINVPPKGSNSYWRDASMTALPPGRRTSKSGKVYYERRANRSDVPGTFAGSIKQMGEKYNGWTNYWTWRWNLEMVDEEMEIDLSVYQSPYDIGQLLKEQAEEFVESSIGGTPFESWMYSVLEEINWIEIANHLIEE